MSTCITIILFLLLTIQPTDKVQRPEGWNTIKIGLSSATYRGLYGI